MTFLHVSFYVVLVYVSLILGIYIKFRIRGVKGKIIFSVLTAPICLLLLTPIYAFRKRFAESEGAFNDRIKKALRFVMLAYKFLPLLVAITAQDIVEQESRKKPPKYTFVVDVFNPYYAGLSTLSAKYSRSKLMA